MTNIEYYREINRTLDDLKIDYNNAMKMLDGNGATKIMHDIYDISRRSRRAIMYEISWIDEFADEAIEPVMRAGAHERIAELESILDESTKIISDFALKTLRINLN